MEAFFLHKQVEVYNIYRINPIVSITNLHNNYKLTSKKKNSRIYHTSNVCILCVGILYRHYMMPLLEPLDPKCESFTLKI
jgi:hypothetical protein